MAKFDWESGKRRKGNKQANRFPPLPRYLVCWDFNRKISFRWDHKSSRGLYLNLQNFWSLDLAETKKNTVIHCESARLTKSSARNLVDASAKSSWLSKTPSLLPSLSLHPKTQLVFSCGIWNDESPSPPPPPLLPPFNPQHDDRRRPKIHLPKFPTKSRGGLKGGKIRRADKKERWYSEEAKILR